jgi:ATP:cob(I)alamin adenosyltransferase
MVKLNKIYTRTGDDGTTGLVRGPRRLKYDLRINCFGTVDEANATIGAARVHTPAMPKIDNLLGRIQNDLFDLGSDLATPGNDPEGTSPSLRITAGQASFLEEMIDQYNEALAPLNSFVLPAGNPLAAALHIARTVTRRQRPGHRLPQPSLRPAVRPRPRRQRQRPERRSMEARPLPRRLQAPYRRREHGLMSSYVQSVVKPGETVLAIGHMHWIVYLRGVILFVIGIGGLLTAAPESFALLVRIVAGIVLVLAVIDLIRAWFIKWTTEIAVTNLRVIQKRGFIRRVTGEMNMDKVESVIVDQSIPGRILDYGSIVVRGTGSGIEGLHYIARPIALRSAIVVH